MPSDIDTLPDVDYLQNRTYGPSNGLDPVILDLPVLMIPSFHVCYAHAVIDYTFLYHWLLSELRVRYPQFHRFIILFEKEEVALDHNVASVIDTVNKCFTIDTWNTLVGLLTETKPLFEHLLDRPYICRHLFFYKKNQIKYQRSPWNSIVAYSHHRPIPPDAVIFTDTLIYRKLDEFRRFIFSQMQLPIPGTPLRSLIIVERSTNRRFDTSLFQALVKECMTTEWEFKGTYCLDQMSFRDQVELFSTTGAFIMRHGSAEINILWAPPRSHLIEIGGGPEGISQPTMYKRICKASDSIHRYFDYTELVKKASKGQSLDIFPLTRSQ
jgi:hypothetical protein